MYNFKDLYLNGKVEFDAINDFIGDWHDGPSTVDLHEFLGLTFKEYSTWVEKDDEALISLLKNNKLLDRINRYQEEPVFHELTCGNNSNHNVLQGKIENDQVILICEDCNYKQNYIPELFLSDEFDKMYNQQLELIKKYSKKRTDG